MKGREVGADDREVAETMVMLEPANIGNHPLAMLPVLTECSFLSSFPAAQNRS